MRSVRSVLALLGFITLAGAVAPPAAAQTRTISGTVRDSTTGDPIGAGSVLVRGTTIGSVIRSDGQFVIPGAPDGNVNLFIRSLGYKSREIPVPAGTNTVNVRLDRDVFKIEQVVITGQATQIERRSAPNAVAMIDAQDLNVTAAPSIEQQLVGKVAGADIQQNSGAPGGGFQVRLRGVTSVNADAQPLYVIDGVVAADVAIPSNQNAVTAAAGGANPALVQDAQVNRIADLNPNDIETIEILKGASASAIYGGRASNGVVIISTKRGRAGVPRLSLRQRVGFSQLLEGIGTRRFNDAAEVDAAFGAGTAARHNFQPGVFFDHDEALAGGNHPVRETTLNISGGSDVTQYFASAQLQNEEGIVIGTGFRREALRLNLDQRFGSRVNASINTSLMHTLADRGLTNNSNAGTSYWYALSSTPSFIDLRQRADGTFPRNPFGDSNPIETASLSKNDEDVYRFIASSRVGVNLWSSGQQSLRVTFVGGTDFFQQKNALFFPPELQFEPQDGLPGTSLLSNSDNLNLNFDAHAVHELTGSGYRATTSAGLQFARRELDITRITSRNLVGGQQNVDAGVSVNLKENRSLVRGFGLFAQEEIQMLSDRLLFTAGVRADQSSVNADASKLYLFPKAAASYRLVALGPLDELKLRAAYGESGNEPIYGQRFTPLTANQNVGGLPGLVNGGTTGSPDLHPERQREIEAGFDANLAAGRGVVEVSVYQKTVSDLLLTRNLPPSSGFLTEIFNGGKLRTRGVELAVGIVPLQVANLNWLFRTTFSSNRSKITELPVPEFITGGFGTSLGAFRIEEGASATQIVGTDTTNTGEVVVRKIGDANPDFRMSFSNDITYGRIALRGLLEWQKGSEIINLTKLLYDFGQTTPDYAVPIAGSSETVGERRLAGFGRRASNYLEDGGYVKLREIALSYDFAPAMLQDALGNWLRSARLTLSGQNLLRWTNYTGFDPEVSNFGNQAIARNIDVTPYPPSRTYYLSIDLGF